MFLKKNVFMNVSPFTINIKQVKYTPIKVLKQYHTGIKRTTEYKKKCPLKDKLCHYMDMKKLKINARKEIQGKIKYKKANNQNYFKIKSSFKGK